MIPTIKPGSTTRLRSPTINKVILGDVDDMIDICDAVPKRNIFIKKL